MSAALFTICTALFKCRNALITTTCSLPINQFALLIGWPALFKDDLAHFMTKKAPRVSSGLFDFLLDRLVFFKERDFCFLYPFAEGRPVFSKIVIYAINELFT